jgi:hypothetical protein
MSMHNENQCVVVKGILPSPRMGVEAIQRRAFADRRDAYIQAAERLQREQRARVLARIGR